MVTHFTNDKIDETEYVRASQIMNAPIEQLIMRTSQYASNITDQIDRAQIHKKAFLDSFATGSNRQNTEMLNTATGTNFGKYINSPSSANYNQSNFYKEDYGNAVRSTAAGSSYANRPFSKEADR